jgi:hypothetical protein
MLIQSGPRSNKQKIRPASSLRVESSRVDGDGNQLFVCNSTNDAQNIDYINRVQARTTFHALSRFTNTCISLVEKIETLIDVNVPCFCIYFNREFRIINKSRPTYRTEATYITTDYARKILIILITFQGQILHQPPIFRKCLLHLPRAYQCCF